MSLSNLRRRLVLFGLLGVLVVLAALTAAFANTGNSDKGAVVVVVNGKEITQTEFYTMLERMAGANALQQLVAQVLLKDAAAEAGYEVTAEALDKELAQIKAQFPNESAFQDALKRYNFTEENLKEDLRLGLIMDYLAVKDVKVTPEEVQKYFDDNRSKYDTPEQVKASHILVKTEEEANDIVKKLKDGADFSELAKEFSQDPGSGPRGGDLGYFSAGEMVEDFEKAAFALKVGEISAPVKTQFGYHIIKLTDRKEAIPAKFEDVKEEIKDKLTKERAKDPQTLIQELLPKAKIEVKWDQYSHLFPAENEIQVEDATPADQAQGVEKGDSTK